MKRQIFLGSVALGASISASIACSEPPARNVSSSAESGAATATPAAASAPAPMTSSDPSSPLRERLVADIARRSDPWAGRAWDQRVLDAMRAVPRHALVPEIPLSQAYVDGPQPIGFGQTISQPTVVAMMTQALDPTEDTTVLEIGTGSGYHAAVVSRLAKHVYTIELHEPLATRARERLGSLGYDNITVRHGDGYAGWKEHAPFDRILLTAAPPEVPRALIDQLAEGGILVAPVGPVGSVQRLYRYRKVNGELRAEDLGGVMFVPMVPRADVPRD